MNRQRSAGATAPLEREFEPSRSCREKLSMVPKHSRRAPTPLDVTPSTVRLFRSEPRRLPSRHSYARRMHSPRRPDPGVSPRPAREAKTELPAFTVASRFLVAAAFRNRPQRGR